MSYRELTVNRTQPLNEQHAVWAAFASRTSGSTDFQVVEADLFFFEDFFARFFAPTDLLAEQFYRSGAAEASRVVTLTESRVATSFSPREISTELAPPSVCIDYSLKTGIISLLWV